MTRPILKTILRKFGCSCWLLLPLFAGQSAWSQDMAGSKNIILSNGAGEHVQIGTVEFKSLGEQKYSFTIDIAPALADYFLAMRPFRCLTGPVQRLCWFPVNREPQVITANDLTPLEYALMFMHSKPTSLNLNPADGVYYKLAWSGNQIVGRLYDVDMDPFITPDSVPLERRTRPLRESDLIPADLPSHWLPVLTIE